MYHSQYLNYDNFLTIKNFLLIIYMSFSPRGKAFDRKPEKKIGCIIGWISYPSHRKDIKCRPLTHKA